MDNNTAKWQIEFLKDKNGKIPFFISEKRYLKKHSDEVQYLLEHLAKLVDLLNEENITLEQLNYHWLRNENNGLLAISTPPHKKGWLALRLYIYPEKSKLKVLTILIGKKGKGNEQSRDIDKAKKLLTDYLKGD